MGAQMTETKLIPFSPDVKLDYQGRTIEGYAAVFGNIDLVQDRIDQGAFSKTLQERGGKIKFLWQHDTKTPMGRVLEMHEDQHGLWFKAIISDTQTGRDALALLKDGAIEGMSIGYEPIVHEYQKFNGQTIRALKEIRLHEISLVTLSANPEAQVTALKEADPPPAEDDGQDDQAEPEPHEEKAGRIIAKRNAERIRQITRLLKELVDDGGLEVDDDEPKAPARAAEEPSIDGQDKPDGKAQEDAGPGTVQDAPPTLDADRLALELELENLRLLEV